jgi:DNA helicase-2/ATP-dependent DNA helicase PcrA
MQAVGNHKDCPIAPSHQTVAHPSDGIFDHFLPLVQSLDIPLGEVAILAPWWVSLFHLARELRSRGLPAIGPGARPYKRSHLVAHLMEPVGAYLESPEPEIAVAVQRALFILIANLTGRSLTWHLIFKGVLPSANC